jgi:hypothetical protein
VFSTVGDPVCESEVLRNAEAFARNCDRNLVIEIIKKLDYSGSKPILRAKLAQCINYFQ